MKNRYGIYILLHISVIILWSVLYLYDPPFLINNTAEITYAAMGFDACLFCALYVYVTTVQRQISLKESLEYFVPALFCGLLICQIQNWIFGAVFLIYLLYRGWYMLREKNGRKSWIVMLFFLLGLVLYLLDLPALSAFMMFAGLAADVFVKYGWANVKAVQILPTAPKYTGYIVLAGVALLGYTAWVFQWETMEITIVVQLFFLLLEVTAVFYLESGQEAYKELSSFFFLAKYVNTERENFSRILHDEVIQDVQAAYHLLSLKKPETELSREVLSSLEKRVRRMMNFYSVSVFAEYGACENIESMFETVGALYPDKKLHIEIKTDERTEQYLRKKPRLELAMQMSRELVNNVFKHADGTYIIYEIILGEDNRLRILCENDGARQEDYENIFRSQGGILLLRILVESRKGTLNHTYKDGVLKSRIELEEER